MRKLFYEDCNLTEFTATVTGCTAAEKGWLVTLDAPPFTPRVADRPATSGLWAV